MNEVFGATIILKNNVSAVMAQSQKSVTGFRAEVDRAKKEIEKHNKQKLKEKELKLKNTKAYQAINQLKQKLEPVTKKTVTITAKAEKAKAEIDKVKRRLASVQDNKVIQLGVKGAAGVTKALGKVVAAGAVTGLLAVAGASAAAVTAAAGFQQQMQQVGTLLDGDVSKKLEGMSSQVLSVSNATGIATSDLTGGLYEVVSAFGESADSVAQLEIAAKAAKAGNASTTDSVKLLSAVTKAYGDTSEEALQKASDLSFLTVKLGQTTFPELAASMGGVVSMASQMAVSQEEVYGAMATLTGVTGSTAEVSTQLEGVLSSFLAPSAQMQKALQSIGYSSGAAALEAEGLGGVIGKLQDSVGGSSLDLAGLFGEKTAKQAVMALSGDLADAWTTKTAAMYDAAGATEAAFAVSQNSVAAATEKLKNFGQNMMTAIGQEALPYIQSALDGLIDKMPVIEQVISKVAGKVGPLITGISGKLSELWTTWQPTLSAISTSFTEAFAVCQPAIEGMLSNFGQIMPYVQPVVETLASTLAASLPVVAGIFEGISSVAAEVFPVVAQIVQEIGGKLQTVFGAIGGHAGTLQQIFAVVGPAISAVLSTAWSVISPILDLAISGVQLVGSVVGKVFPYIQGILTTVWSIISPVIEGIGSAISALSGILDKIRGVLGGGDSTKSGHVDANATGTDYFSGGWTTVGEHGPELMRLPGGTQILSNSDSRSFSGKNSPNIHINIEHMEVRSEADIDAIAEMLASKIEEAEAVMA